MRPRKSPKPYEQQALQEGELTKSIPFFKLDKNVRIEFKQIQLLRRGVKMTLRTPDDMKDLIDKAITLSAEEAMVLEGLSLEDPALPIKLAAQLLLVPGTVRECLIRLKEKGLVINASPPKRKEIIASEVDEYFLLSDEGRKVKTVLPLIKKIRGAS
jgi:DNA-binding MarR family transcriptional regulator